MKGTGSKDNTPRVGSVANACTDVSTPERTGVPSSDNENVRIESRIVRLSARCASPSRPRNATARCRRAMASARRSRPGQATSRPSRLVIGQYEPIAMPRVKNIPPPASWPHPAPRPHRSGPRAALRPPSKAKSRTRHSRIEHRRMHGRPMSCSTGLRSRPSISGLAMRRTG